MLKTPATIPAVLRQHVDESMSLALTRQWVLQSPGITLEDLRRFDDRLVAHLDGVAVAGEDAWAVLDDALDDPSAGAVFTAAVIAVGERSQERLDRLFTPVEASPALRAGLDAAFGWMLRDRLQGIVANLLGSSNELRRVVGIAACAAHGVDPGLLSGRWLDDASMLVRARAVRMSGEIGYRDAAPACLSGMDDPDPDGRFWCTWSLVMLGNRGKGLDALARIAAEDGDERTRAFRLALQAMSLGTAHAMLQQTARDPSRLRLVIEGSGIAGDPSYVPWLIGHMKSPTTARLAGEALSLITGADLDRLQLFRPQPEDFEAGPTEDPEDENVEIDPDEGLMWPDPERVQKWWDANRHRFQAGQRYFIGAPITREHCIDVLKNGYQCQRILAAHYLCLLEPGTPLFNTSAPAWRQQKLLAQM